MNPRPTGADARGVLRSHKSEFLSTSVVKGVTHQNQPPPQGRTETFNENRSKRTDTSGSFKVSRRQPIWAHTQGGGSYSKWNRMSLGLRGEEIVPLPLSQYPIYFNSYKLQEQNLLHVGFKKPIFKDTLNSFKDKEYWFLTTHMNFEL